MWVPALTAALTRDSGTFWQELLQLRILDFGFFQDGDVGVGIFPECQEILIRSFRLGGVAGKRVSTPQAKMRQRPYRRVGYDTSMFEEFLELRRSFGRLICGQIGFSSQIDRLTAPYA